MALIDTLIKGFRTLLGGGSPRKKRRPRRSNAQKTSKSTTRKKRAGRSARPRRRPTRRVARRSPRKPAKTPKKKTAQVKRRSKKSLSRPPAKPTRPKAKKSVAQRKKQGGDKKTLSLKRQKTGRKSSLVKTARAASLPVRPPSGLLIGRITHYFSKIMVCVVKMDGPLSVGDTIRIQGRQREFDQKVESLQIESVNVPRAKKGQMVGLKVKKECREGDLVFRLKK